MAVVPHVCWKPQTRRVSYVAILYLVCFDVVLMEGSFFECHLNVIAFKLLKQLWVLYQLASVMVTGRERITVNLGHLLQPKTEMCPSFWGLQQHCGELHIGIPIYWVPTRLLSPILLFPYPSADEFIFFLPSLKTEKYSTQASQAYVVFLAVLIYQWVF